jgi:quinol monooxygenase YgiN
MSKIAIVGEITTKDGQFDEYLRRFVEHARASRAEAGCLRFDVAVPKKGENKFHFYEIWADREALDAHAGTERIKAHREATKPLQVDSKITFCTLHDSADV